MNVVILWAVWITFVSTPPDTQYILDKCGAEPGETKIAVAPAPIIWDDNLMTTVMFTCARVIRSDPTDDEPSANVRKWRAYIQVKP